MPPFNCVCVSDNKKLTVNTRAVAGKLGRFHRETFSEIAHPPAAAALEVSPSLSFSLSRALSLFLALALSRGLPLPLSLALSLSHTRYKHTPAEPTQVPS